MKEVHSRRSFIHSWHSSRDEFIPTLKSLQAGKLQDCVSIYHTRHKECRLVSKEISGLPYAAVYKRYCEKRFFRYLFRPSMAYREYCGFKLTEKAGIPVAKVLALGEIRRGIVLKEAFFVTEYLENFRSGHEVAENGADEKVRDEFIRINMCYIARLHSAGLVHGGFHPRNELFQIGADGSMTVVWIDLATVAPSGKNRRFSQKDDLDLFFKKLALPPEKEAYYRELYANERAK